MQDNSAMLIDVLTLFPGMFKGPFDSSIIKRAQEEKLAEIDVHNIRDWAENKHKQVDDKPYGGDGGMILKPEPVFKAVFKLQEKFYRKHKKKEVSHVILMTPAGRRFNYRIAEKLSALSHLIIICGHYEGVDNRIFENLADEKLSIGDYILTGGELPAMVLIDAVVRLIPKVLSKEEATRNESFSFQGGLLEYPQYTRPEDFEGMKVPQVLTSGNHEQIKRWRKEKALERTKTYRPDLLNIDS